MRNKMTTGKLGRTAAVLTLVLGTAFLPARARGWGLTWMGNNLEAALRNARTDVGPLRLDSALRLTYAGYDSNIYFGAPEVAVEDYLFSVGPDLRAFLPASKSLVFELAEFPQYAYFVRTGKERTWNNAFLAQAHLVLKRVYVLLGQGLTSTREHWSPEADLRVRRREDRRHGLILWQASRTISFSVDYSAAKYRHDNLASAEIPVSERLDRSEDYVNLSAYYQPSPKLRLFADGEYGIFDFVSEARPGKPRSYRASAGLEFLPGGPFRGRLNLGYKSFRAANPQEKDYSGIYGNTSVTVKPTRLMELSALFARDIQFSVWYDNTSFVQTVFGGGVTRLLSRRLRLDYQLLFSRNQYALRTADPENPWQDKLDRQVSHSVRLRVQMGRKLEVGLRGSWVNRKSDLSWANGKRTIAAMEFAYGF